MKRYLFSLAGIALLLAGCASIAGPMGGGTVVDLQKKAFALKLGFQAALVPLVGYIETPRCGRPTSPTLCSQQDVVDVMRDSIAATDKGISAAEKTARTLNPDSTVLSALVTAAEQSVVAMQKLNPKK